MPKDSGGDGDCLPRRSAARPSIDQINPHIVCVLCSGYFIDATTVVECLHSFCRGCIVRYLEHCNYCPICDVLVHKTRPLSSLRLDTILQELVYKLVPGLYSDEMRRRRDFYGSRAHPAGPTDAGEARGHERRTIFSPDETVTVRLQPCPSAGSVPESSLYVAPSEQVRYLRCSASVTVGHLQHLLRCKYGLPGTAPSATRTAAVGGCQVQLLWRGQTLAAGLQLLDVAYLQSWRRVNPLLLLYRIVNLSAIDHTSSSSHLRVEIKSEHHPADFISASSGSSDRPLDTASHKGAIKTELDHLSPSVSSGGASAVALSQCEATVASGFFPLSVSSGGASAVALSHSQATVAGGLLPPSVSLIGASAVTLSQCEATVASGLLPPSVFLGGASAVALSQCEATGASSLLPPSASSGTSAAALSQCEATGASSLLPPSASSGTSDVALSQCEATGASSLLPPSASSGTSDVPLSQCEATGASGLLPPSVCSGTSAVALSQCGGEDATTGAIQLHISENGEMSFGRTDDVSALHQLDSALNDERRPHLPVNSSSAPASMAAVCSRGTATSVVAVTPVSPGVSGEAGLTAVSNSKKSLKVWNNNNNNSKGYHHLYQQPKRRRSSPIGYKTLKMQPKFWNQQLTHVLATGGSASSGHRLVAPKLQALATSSPTPRFFRLRGAGARLPLMVHVDATAATAINVASAPLIPSGPLIYPHLYAAQPTPVLHPTLTGCTGHPAVTALTYASAATRYQAARSSSDDGGAAYSRQSSTSLATADISLFAGAQMALPSINESLSLYDSGKVSACSVFAGSQMALSSSTDGTSIYTSSPSLFPRSQVALASVVDTSSVGDIRASLCAATVNGFVNDICNISSPAASVLHTVAEGCRLAAASCSSSAPLHAPSSSASAATTPSWSFVSAFSVSNYPLLNLQAVPETLFTLSSPAPSTSLATSSTPLAISSPTTKSSAFDSSKSTRSEALPPPTVPE